MWTKNWKTGLPPNLKDVEQEEDEEFKVRGGDQDEVEEQGGDQDEVEEQDGDQAGD